MSSGQVQIQQTFYKIYKNITKALGNIIQKYLQITSHT